MGKKKLSTPRYSVRKAIPLKGKNKRPEQIDLRGLVNKKGIIVAGKKTQHEKLRVEVDITKNPVGYLIMAINDATTEFGVSLEEGLMLMYLYEIGGFGLHINTNNRRVAIGDYEKMGYIELVYKKESIYQLSPLGKQVVMFIYDRVKDPTRYLRYLQVSQKESTDEVARVLGKYFG